LIDILATVLIATLLVYIYWPCRRGQFLFDDLPLWDAVAKVRLVPSDARFPWFAVFWWRSQGRWLALWTLKCDVISHDPQQPPGESDDVYLRRIAGWHDRNIALHVLCSVILYAILRYWFPVGPALIGALCGSVHPLCTATTASIVGRYGLMCALFYVSSILAFLLGAWWLIPALAYCGWHCKQDILALPAALTVIWYWS
jgi:hypothetical protein